MSAQTLALVYTALSALPGVMHAAVSLGAPVGRYTVGGRFPGRLPPAWRAMALVQLGLLLAMSCAVLDRGGALALDLPPFVFWLALAMTGLTTIANNISPSRPERLLWGPVTLGMTIAAIGVATGGILQ